MKGLLAAALVAFAGCGACDQPREDGRRLDDGLAPYREAGQVELCIGTTRLVPRPGDDLGLCRATGRGARACLADAECGATEACICGRCSVRLCEASVDCRPGLACIGTPRRCARRCDADTDCPTGQLCEGTVCTAACDSEATCAEGELCLAGRCTVVSCLGASGCAGGEQCDLQLREGALRAPGALAGEDGEVVLYVELADATSSSVVRATAADDLRFVASPESPVLAPAAPATRVGAPSPLVVDGAVELYVELGDGEAIGRSRAADGFSFGPPEIVLEPGPTWEGGRVGSPAAILFGGEVVLFYEGGDGAGIGMAVGPPGGALVRRDAPLITAADLESPGFSEVDRISAPWPVLVETALGDIELRLFVGARGREDPAPEGPDGGLPLANTSIGLFLSRSAGAAGLAPVRFPFNPVLARFRNLEPLGEDDPTVVSPPRHPHLLYFESDDAVSLATNPPP